MRLVDKVLELKGMLTENYDYLYLEEGDKDRYGYESDEECIIDNACPHHLHFLNAEHIGENNCVKVGCKECWNREYISI